MNEDLPPSAAAERPLDVDATDGCPTAPACASCSAGGELAVHTAGTPVGVYCVTLCWPCAEAGDLPQLGGWAAAVELVLAHCGHLGCDSDEMAAALLVDEGQAVDEDAL